VKKVLIVDDEKKIVHVLKAYLEKEGYQVLTAHDGNSALSLSRQETPDLLLLDLMLPGINGEEVCRTLRQEGSKMPVIMLTAKTDLDDKLYGLGVGADDYITKPFSPQEVVARVKSVLRRTSDESGPLADIFSRAQGNLVVDTLGHKISWKGSALDLTPTEFKLLETMARHPGWVYSRSRLTEAVLDYDYDGFDRTIDVHIKNLRRKLKQSGVSDLIQTVYGVGYKFEDQ